MRVRASLAAVLTVLGFMVLTSATATSRARRSAEPRRSQLVRLIRARQHEVAALEDQLGALEAKANRVRRSVLRRQQIDTVRLKREQLLAGLTPVEGRGIEVVVRDSNRTTRDPAVKDALRIRDTDLQRIVNAMWQSGAEAIAVNGQRLVATTAIRIAGDTVTVNFKPLTSPYHIAAVGTSKQTFSATPVARQFHRWIAAYGLGFAVHGKGRVRVEAFTGRIGPALAVPDVPASAPGPG